MQERESQARSAEMQAAFHRQRAGEFFAEHRRQRSPSFLTRAQDEMAKAAEFEKQALQMRNQGRGERSKEPGDTKVANVAANRTGPANNKAHGESERATRERARRWYEPGSVASDTMTQLSEANQGGGILAQAASYAARSTFDKEHRSMSGAKALGEAMSAPAKAVGAAGKAVGAAGKDILNAARQYQVASSRQERAGRSEAEQTVTERSKGGHSKTGREQKSPTQTKQRSPQEKSREQASRQRASRERSSGRGHER